MSLFIDFLKQLQQHESTTCVERGGPSYTYAELLKEIDQWQTRFHELNVKAGTVVALRADYSFSAVAALLALIARRAVAVLVPRVNDIDQYLVSAHASAFADLNVDGAYDWHRLPPPMIHPLLDQLYAAGEGGLILFTSGSTGDPKAVLQSAERFLCKFRKPGRRFRTLAFPLFDHVAGLDTLFYTLASGGTLVLTRRRDPGSVITVIESSKVEVLPTSPSFLRLLCPVRGGGKHGLPSLKVITYGSEPMDYGTLARLKARFPGAEILQKYGTTETGSPKSLSRTDDSLWLKIKTDGVQTKVVDSVLWIRSESMMLGYLNAPSPVDPEGWFCTGDLVDVDGHWLRFRGRATTPIDVARKKAAHAVGDEPILIWPRLRGFSNGVFHLPFG